MDVVQVIYNIFDQAPEDKLFPLCRELNIGVIARVPLDEGSLGGKMTPETKFPGDDWRARYFGPENMPEDSGARRGTEKGSAAGDEPAGNGPALHPVESGREHHDHRHEETRARETKYGDERCRPARRRASAETEEPPLGPHLATLGRLI